MIRIIGAGFSGLSLAYHFVKQGVPVTIVDKRARPGGVIDSYVHKGVLIESAANGFLASEKIEELFKDIGLELLPTKQESKKKYIYRNGLKRWPLTIFESIVLVLKFTFAFITGQKSARSNESLKHWADRVLGPAGNSYLIQPMVNGIFAQKTAMLDAQLVLGSLFFKKKKGSVKGLMSSKNGMGEVILKLENWLKQRGVHFIYGETEKINSNPMQHNTFLATDLYSLNSAFTNFKPQNLLTKQDDLKTLSLARITISFKFCATQIDGFGVLFPNEERFNALGVLANTKIFENRGEYNESWIFADSNTPNLMNLSDSEVLERIIQDRKRLFSTVFEIKDCTVHRWPNVIPSYDAGLKKFLSDNQELTSHLAGNYLGVLGLTGIHERNHQLVASFMEKRKSI